MNWYLLSGAFLVGLAAWAAPLILHWLQRKPKQPVDFPAFDFLILARKTNRRSNNWRKWLVLLLRLAAIGLFVAAFCRPFRAGSAPQPARVRVLLWDDSGSVGTEWTRDRLERMLRHELASVSPQAPAAIGLVREKGRIVWSGDFTGDPRILLDWFAANRRNEGGSDFSTLPVRVDFKFKNQTAPRREVVLFSDLQTLPWKGLDRGAKLREADDMRLESAPLPTNALALRAPETMAIPATAQESAALEVACEAVNTGVKPLHDLTAVAETLDGARSECKIDVLAPGAVRRLEFRLSPVNGATAGSIRVDADDACPSDNVLYFADDPEAQTRLLVGTPPEGHFDFTAMALGVKTVDPADQETGLTAEEPSGRMVFWQDPARLTPETQRRLAAFVAAGGTLVVNLSAGSPELSALVAKWGVELSPRRAQQEGTFHFGGFDFSHPALARMRDWSLNGWFDVLFFRICTAKLPPGTRVLATFDNGCPAVAEITAGRGRVVAVFSGFDPEQGNWPSHYSFLPFWRELARYYTGKNRPPELFQVGDPGKPIPGTQLEYRMPDGSWRAVTAAPDGMRFDRAGIYRRTGTGKTRLYAVNPPPEESDFTALTEPPLPQGTPDVGRHRDAAPTPADTDTNKDELFRTLLWAALACWLASLLLANRTAL